jgi:NCS1 family nucleobase:cation symporter-1
VTHSHLHSLIYYVSFLIFPFETETDEEDKAMDIIEALDYEGSQAASGGTIDPEKVAELSE